MTNRKKRLKKGIESLEKQIAFHEQKLQKAVQEDHLELAGYYKKEILAKKKDMDEKKRLLEKGG